MKLSMEQHAQLDKMAGYFDKIEEIAERMGVEVDALVEEIKQNNSAVYLNLKQNLLGNATNRQQIFNRYYKSGNTGHASIVNLNVIVNEDRF
ncbi:hypothetical protein BH11BAC1_BH11BAC1_07990 [soil metagenome]